MGAADINTARTDNLMRQHLLGNITKAFQERLTLFNLIFEGSAETITSAGIEFVMNVLSAGPGRFGPEQVAFPNPVPLTDVKALMKYCTYYRTVAFSGHEYDQMKNLSDSEILEKLIQRIDRDMKSAKKQMNQYGYGDTSGEVGRVITGSGLPAAVTSPVYLSQTTANGNTYGNYKFIPGAYYQFYTAAGVQRTDGSVTRSKCVTSVKSNTASYVTFDNLPNTAGTPTLANGDIIVAAGDKGYALAGLDYFFATSGQKQNLSLDQYDALRATSINTGGASINAILLSKLSHIQDYRVEEEVSNNAIILAAPSQVYGYMLNGHPLRRATMADRSYDGSFTQAEYDGNIWTKCPDCPRDTVYRWMPGDIERAEWRPYDYFSLNGQTEHLAWGGAGDTTGDGAHVFRILMYFIWVGQFFCRNPNNLSVLRGLSMTGLPNGFD